MSNVETRGWAGSAPAAGVMLVVTAALVVFTMGHHPTGHGGGADGISLGNVVHAAMIVFLVAQLWAVSVFAVKDGPDGWRLAGLVAYAISVICHVIAATINGFIVPALAGAVDGTASHDLFVLLWHANQSFATLGVHAIGLGFMLWGYALLRRGGLPVRVAGAAGLFAGLLPSGLLIGGVIALNVDGTFIVYAAHSAWVAFLGVLMWQSRI